MAYANQEVAFSEKELGNNAYRRREFDLALYHYSLALELDPTNIIYRTNRAAVYFEQGDYARCIRECDEAVNIGRQHHADFKLIAKALARIGNAFYKQHDLDAALVYYNKSLSEFRDPEVICKSQAVEHIVRERDRLAYIDPQLSKMEKQLGNELFLKGDYPGALKHYTEAIKRDPSEAILYSNRAACYTKLLEFSMALRDSEECIRRQPNFIKGYLHKGTSLLAMKEARGAAEAFQKALELDANCQEAINGYRSCLRLEHSDPEAVRRRAMQDPEVQMMLADPAMQMILQQMQSDPHALQEHVKNPGVARRIEKLLEVGLIAIR